MLRKTIGALIAASAIGFATLASAAEITGAGSTFAGPIFTKWGEQYAAAGGDKLNYQPVGSGAGVTQIINRTVNFGASDAAVTTERLATNNLLQFPSVIGAVVVAVNIPGVDGNTLKLTGPLIADMYLGKIRMWNDPRISALNPSVKFPPVAIAATYRADSSGTTNVFTNYLSAVSPDFKARVGAGNSVAWKAGLGAPGNAGVAGAIKNIRGGLGYIEYAFALENHMQMPALQNRAGTWVKPSMPSFQASANAADWKNAPNMAASMINTVGAPNWPIVSATYVLLPKNSASAEAPLRVIKFFDWAFKNGGPATVQLHYIQLPTAVQDQVRAAWKQLKVGNQVVWAGE